MPKREYYYNRIITENKCYSPIPKPFDGEVLLIKNPRNRLGPKHIYTKESFPNSCCGGYHLGGTRLLRVSDNLEESVEIVEKDYFNSEDEILCVNCSKTYNKEND